jgi:hypothetical protein
MRESGVRDALIIAAIIDVAITSKLTPTAGPRMYGSPTSNQNLSGSPFKEDLKHASQP